MVASGRANITPSDAGRDSSSCVQETMGLSRRAPRRGSQLQQTQEHRALLQLRRQPRQAASTLRQWRQRTVSWRRAAKRLLEPHPAGPLPQRTTKPWNRRSPRAKVSGLWLVSQVCSLLPPDSEIPVNYVKPRMRSTRSQSTMTRRASDCLQIW